MATCYKEDLNGHAIILTKETLEIQSTRIKVGALHYTITNAYLHTYKSFNLLRSMIKTLGNSLAQLNAKFPTDTRILIGDFNMPKLRWEFMDDNANYLSNVATNLSENEKYFAHVCASLG